jgi:hypothetical protein
MIKEENVQINLNPKTIKHYLNIGYIGNINEIINVKVEDLTKGSHVKITSVCDICSVENKITYKSYLRCIKNSNYYTCHKCCLSKKQKTWLKTLGVNHPSLSKDVREKIEKTNIEKYGDRYFILTDKFIKDECINKKRKNTRMKLGLDIPDDKLSEWEIYKKQVRRETNKQRKILINNWNGYDYYDGEYIKDNFIKYKPRHTNYPSIDHKISVKYGFDNNIDYKKICDIDNLCITKTSNNCSKRHKNNENISINTTL